MTERGTPEAAPDGSEPIVITSHITLTVDGQTLSRVIQTKTVARGRRKLKDDEDGPQIPPGSPTPG